MLSLTFYVYIAAIVAYIVREVWRAKTIRWIAFGVFVGGFILNTIVLWNRMIEAQHAPMSDKYESFIFFAWSIALVYLIFELVTIFMVKVHESRIGIIGALQCVLAVFMINSALGVDSSIRELPPALQSNWLVTHVICYFLSYSALSMSFSAAIVHLIRKAFVSDKQKEGVVVAASESQKKKDYSFDKLAYIAVSIGFPVFNHWFDYRFDLGKGGLGYILGMGS